MKNVLPHDVRTLIIAGIVATIIPTPIDFNNLIIFIRGGSFPEYIPILYTACLQILIHITKKSKKATNKNKQLNVLTFY